MGHRLSRIYTRTGDHGETGLGDGSRIAKSSLRIEVLGTLDELNALLGVVIAQGLPNPTRVLLSECQQQLFDLGGELCVPGREQLAAQAVQGLEGHLDRLNQALPPLREFILPGGNPAAAHCHHARTVCRRAERACVTLAEHEPVNPQALAYLNRLSDLLFVLARTLARVDDGQEVLWSPDRE